jgi:hypothetical protein
MGLDQEKTRAFRRLYVATNQLMTGFEATGNAGPFDESCVQRAIANIDQMISLLPFEFPVPALRSSTDRMLPINQNDAEDEPQPEGDKFPEGIIVYYDSYVSNDLTYWKLLILSRVAYFFPEPAIVDKYKPLIFQQAEQCLDALPQPTYGQEWLMNRITFCANQIGWVAYEFDDPQKLEAALVKVERGFEYSLFEGRKYIKNKKAYLLLKLGRNEEAFQIVFDALRREADDPDFAALKADERYLLWLEEKAKKEEAAKQELQKAYESFLQFVAAEQAKVTNQFIHPKHPLVVEHTALLNLIKQRMISVALHEKYRKSGWKTAEEEEYKNLFELKKCSLKKLEEFEEKQELRLPDELKVYLMEIGAGGKGYFSFGNINLPDKKSLEKAKKTFPVTPDKIHDIQHVWGIKAWINPRDKKDWVAEGVFKKNDDLELLFGLPEKVKPTEGCLYLGPSYSQEELYLVINGAFEGEVWADSLFASAEEGGCFGAASAQRLTLLPFIAESLQAKQQQYENVSDGMWF